MRAGRAEDCLYSFLWVSPHFFLTSLYRSFLSMLEVQQLERFLMGASLSIDTSENWLAFVDQAIVTFWVWV